MKKLFTFFFAVLLSATMVHAQDTPCIMASGYCGAEGDSTNLRWELSCDGVLTISGSGAHGSSPWKTSGYRDAIRTAIISDSVTSFKGQVFSGCDNLSHVELPFLLTSIESGMFRESGLNEIEIPEKVASIGDYAFKSCRGLQTVTLPSEVAYIGKDAFRYCSELASITCHAIQCPQLGTNVFSGVNKSTSVLYVPAASITLYQATDQWSEFTNILPIPGTEEPTPCFMASGTCGDNLTWELGCDSVLAISGTGAMNDYSANAPWSFSYSKIIKSVRINDGVTAIGRCAFQSCSNLVDVTIPYSVTRIGSQAFYMCSALQTITIPESVIEIGSYALTGCGKLTSPMYNSHVFAYLPQSYSGAYEIPEGIETIAADAFYNCYKLTAIKIPNSIKTIPNYAFYNCTALTSVDIGDSVTTINKYAFYGCKSLPVVDNLRYADTYLVEAINKSLSSYTIKDGTKWIGFQAFSNCDSLVSITIPNSVTIIAENAFAGCDNLTSVIGGDAVEVIEFGVFQNCKNLKSVKLGDNLTSIGQLAFTNCTSLDTLVIPEKVDTIFKTAFNNCSNLKVIISNAMTPPVLDFHAFYNVDSFIPVYVPVQSVATYRHTDGWKDFANIMPKKADCIIASGTCGEQGDNLTWELSCDGVLAIEGSGAMATYWDSITVPWYDYRRTDIRYIYIGDEVTSVGTQAFMGCGLAKEIILPNTINSIGEYAFAHCELLQSITIPESVSTFGYHCFSGCNNLPVKDGLRYADTYLAGRVDYYRDSYTIQEGTKWIGDGIFYNSSLRTISIPGSVTKIGENAFAYCNQLQSLYNYARVPQVIANNVFENVNHKGDTLYVLPQSLALYQNADGWKEFANIMPMRYEGVGKCGDNLTWELSLDGVLTISGFGEMYDFRDTTQVPWYAYRSKIQRVELPDSLTSIGAHAFENSVVKSITIPDGVRYIGDYAFNYCWRLESLTVGRNVEQIGVLAFGRPSNLKYFEWNAINCPADTVFYLASDMNYDGYSEIPFFMDSVQTIVFGPNVLNIPDGLCSRMGNWEHPIERIVLPDSLWRIGAHAFENSVVKSITIPDGVRSIGDYAFNGSWLLNDITMQPMTPPAISGDSTFIFPDSATIYVACAAFNNYQTAWPMYAHQIQGKGGEVVTVVEDHICAGDSIFFGGQFISQSGIYIDTLTSYMGCDSIVELHLADLPTYYAYREIYLCAGDSVFFGGRVLKEPGIYRDTLPTYMGCDSTMELKLNVIPNYYFYDTITMYEGESYSWRGKTIMAAGDYYDYYQTVDYCDSVYALHVNLIKMCSWKVESKDITMGAVSTTFHASAYPYGTQIKVEALPNSGYKFVKWNDGKKYNPYTFTILDDKYLMAIFMEEEVEPDTTVVVPTVSTVTVTWPVVEDSYRYSLTIYLDAACTIPFCTVTFDASGRVLDISFAQQAPSRLRRQVEGFTYTVPGLDAATKYYYKMEATDVEGKLLNTDEGDFETKADIGTALDETETVSAPAKILRNGHVLILRGDKTYTVTGAEVK